MTIESIDNDKCVGCGTCVAGCACDVIRIDKETKKAKIAYQEDCQNCHLCRYFCPEGAVSTSTRLSQPPMVSWG